MGPHARELAVRLSFCLTQKNVFMADTSPNNLCIQLIYLRIAEK
jgi:hypothetical protein